MQAIPKQNSWLRLLISNRTRPTLVWLDFSRLELSTFSRFATKLEVWDTS
jgi:hypothetical protein